ncbi:MAG: hypothetical protein AB7G87_06985 [Clostridia bacterium]
MKLIIKAGVVGILFLFMTSNVLAAVGLEDKVSIFGSVNMEKPVNGSVVAVFGSVNAGYDVSGDIVTILGSANIQSKVSGDVVAIFGSVTLGPQADVNGDVVSIGPGGIKRDSGSKIQGDSVGINIGSLDLSRFKIHFPSLGLLGNVGFIIISLLALFAIIVSGERVKNMAECVEDNIIRKVLVGVIILFCFPIISIFSALTIIGLPIAVIFFGIAFVLGFAAMLIYTGRKILELFNGSSNIYGEFITGAAIFAVIMSTVHFSGWISIALVTVSLGICFDTRFGKKTSRISI